MAVADPVLRSNAGVVKDLELALHYFELGAEMHDPQALVALATLLNKGLCLVRDPRHSQRRKYL